MVYTAENVILLQFFSKIFKNLINTFNASNKTPLLSKQLLAVTLPGVSFAGCLAKYSF